MHHEQKEIPFTGNYWWGTEKEVTEPLAAELKKILGETMISHIDISGTDFNDGRERRSIRISVDCANNVIRITKDYQ